MAEQNQVASLLDASVATEAQSTTSCQYTTANIDHDNMTPPPAKLDKTRADNAPFNLTRLKVEKTGLHKTFIFLTYLGSLIALFVIVGQVISAYCFYVRFSVTVSVDLSFSSADWLCQAPWQKPELQSSHVVYFSSRNSIMHTVERPTSNTEMLCSCHEHHCDIE